MTTVEKRSAIRIRVDAGIGWVSPDHAERTDVREVKRELFDALADLIENPSVQTIILADFPASILSGSTGGASESDELLTEHYHQVSDRLWRSSKTLIVRRHADRGFTSTAPDAPVYIEPLTERERQVLSMACEGTSARDIGDRLFISERTVESHVGNGYRKLGIRSRIELIKRAAEFGL